MVTLKEVYQLNERADFQYIAQELVDYYGLKSKVKFTSDAGVRGHYVPEKDTIFLKRSYSSVKEFIISVLHEIQHAKDAKRLGIRKYSKQYDQAGTMAAHQGKDPYWANKWEKRAEKWGKQEYRKRWKNKF
jgi:hypothetical protein